TRDQVEERRLPGAVRSDHAHDLALVHVQIEVRDAREAPEALRHSTQIEKALGHAVASTRVAPTSPWGLAFISTIRMTPIMIRRVMLGSNASLASQTNTARYSVGTRTMLRQNGFNVVSTRISTVRATKPQLPAWVGSAGMGTQCSSQRPSSPVTAPVPSSDDG